jgi:predicted Zn-dependent protease
MKKLIALSLTALLVSACASSDKKDKGGDDLKSSKDDGEGGGGNGKPDSAYASSNRVTLTNSLSYNGLTSQTISSSKAENEAQRYNGKDKRSLEGKISADRLARKSPGTVLAAAKKLAELEMEKGAGRTVGADVKLEIALAALQGRNFALAEYYLQELTDKGVPARVKAGAYNALGVIAMRDDRVPEAVLYFKEALKASGNYKPALLNLGFAALKGGDLSTAKKALGDLQGDWFVQYGLISVARMEGNESRADDLCDKVLGKEPGHKAALFNCGLVEFQNKRNFGKAKDLLSKAMKAKGGEPGWDDKISQVYGQVQSEEVQAKAAAPKDKKP